MKVDTDHLVPSAKRVTRVEMAMMDYRVDLGQKVIQAFQVWMVLLDCKVLQVSLG